METFKSNDNPFLKIDPFEKGNILDKFKMLIKNKDKLFLMEIGDILDKKLNEFTLNEFTLNNNLLQNCHKLHH
tara:strand:+ start:420 stop:638 length:219 start_codon:yes stop_codon:yes gene_type:complete